MLKDITWHQFIYTALFLMAAYYLAIAILYYRNDILRWSSYKINIKSAAEDRPAPSDNAKENALYTDVRGLMEELKTVFEEAAKKKIVRQELILSIQNKLKGYPQIKGTEIEYEISRHIENECREKCAVDLDKEETQNLWGS